jgi:hypothetical protein
MFAISICLNLYLVMYSLNREISISGLRSISSFVFITSLLTTDFLRMRTDNVSYNVYMKGFKNLKLYFTNKKNSLKDSTNFKDSAKFSFRLWAIYELTIPLSNIGYTLEARYGMEVLNTIFEIIAFILILSIILIYFYFFFILLFNSFKTNKWKSFLGYCFFLVGVAYFAFLRSIDMSGIFGF